MDIGKNMTYQEDLELIAKTQSDEIRRRKKQHDSESEMAWQREMNKRRQNKIEGEAKIREHGK